MNVRKGEKEGGRGDTQTHTPASASIRLGESVRSPCVANPVVDCAGLVVRRVARIQGIEGGG